MSRPWIVLGGTVAPAGRGPALASRRRRAIEGARHGVLSALVLTATLLLTPVPGVGGPAYDNCVQAGAQSPEGPLLDLAQLCADVENTVQRGSRVAGWFQGLARGTDFYLLLTPDCRAERALLESLERAIMDTEVLRANVEQFLAYQASAGRGPSRLGQFLSGEHRKFSVLSRDLRQSRVEDRCRAPVPDRPDPPPPPPPRVQGQPAGPDVLRYEPPLVDGHPVAFIPAGGGDSRRAADAFCQLQGYARSVRHGGQSHSTTPTWHVDSRQPCRRGSNCGLLTIVECDTRARFTPFPR